MNSRNIIILTALILIILVIYVNRYDYEHISAFYSDNNNNNNNNDNDIKRLIDIELTKRLGDISKGDRLSTISQIEDLIHLLNIHLKNYQNNSIITESKYTSITNIEPCSNNSTTISIPVPVPVPVPVPLPCPAPIPIPCPVSDTNTENKPPYFSKLGPINRKLDIGNPDTRDAWIKTKANTLCKPNFSILDVSAGVKPYQHLWLKSGCKFYSNEFGGNVDIVDNFRGETRKNELSKMHDYIGTDITNTNAPSNSFDITVLTEVLEHLPEPALAIPGII